MNQEELIKELFEQKMQTHKLFDNLKTNQEKIMTDINSLKSKSGKDFYIIIVIVFLGAYIIGTKHNDFKEYYASAFDVVKNVVNIQSKVVHKE